MNYLLFPDFPEQTRKSFKFNSWEKPYTVLKVFVKIVGGLKRCIKQESFSWQQVRIFKKKPRRFAQEISFKTLSISDLSTRRFRGIQSEKIKFHDAFNSQKTKKKRQKRFILYDDEKKEKTFSFCSGWNRRDCGRRNFLQIRKRTLVLFFSVKA